MLVVTEFPTFLSIKIESLSKPDLGGILVEESKYRLSISTGSTLWRVTAGQN